MALKDNLKSARERAGLTQKKLAGEAGVSQQLISQIERGVPSAGKEILPQIAAALGVTVEALDPDFWDVPRVQAIRQAAGAAKGFASPASVSRLPVFASARGGDAEVIIGNEPIDYASHPLENVVGAYTTYVVGDSMEPLFEQGDLVLVNPHLPPRAGVDVVLQTDAESGERAAMVKRLVRASADSWQLEQFNPRKRFKLDRKQWPTCHVVVGKYSRR